MLRQFNRVFLFMVVLLLTFSVATVFAAKQYPDLKAAEVKEMMATGDVLVVFPLSPIEYDDLHIKYAVNVPMDLLATKLPQDKSKKMIFYCLGIKCVASWRAAEKALELGYENVYTFREGLPAWVDAGYPTVTTAKLPDVPVNRISTADLAARLDNENFTLIDINLNADAQKFWIEHPNRVHVPLDELKARVSELDKSDEIAVMCLKGKRSPTAVRFLISQGFENVVMVEGGIQKWVLEGRPVQQGS